MRKAAACKLQVVGTQGHSRAHGLQNAQEQRISTKVLQCRQGSAHQLPRTTSIAKRRQRLHC